MFYRFQSNHLNVCLSYKIFISTAGLQPGSLLEAYKQSESEPSAKIDDASVQAQLHEHLLRNQKNINLNAIRPKFMCLSCDPPDCSFETICHDAYQVNAPSLYDIVTCLTLLTNCNCDFFLIVLEVKDQGLQWS